MNYRTPNVYIKDLTPPTAAVKDIASAVPAFVGYSAKAIDREGRPLVYVPTKIRNLEEFEAFFGQEFQVEEITVVLGSEPGMVKSMMVQNPYYLYPSVQLFFLNGGEACHIVSIGSYEDGRQYIGPATSEDDSCISPDLRPAPEPTSEIIPEQERFLTGLEALEQEDEPTLILFPDATRMRRGALPDHSALGFVQQMARRQCLKLKDRFCLFDLMESYSLDEELSAFRNATGNDHLSYAAAYHPWVYSSLDAGVSLRSLVFRDQNGRPMSVRQVLESESPSAEGTRLNSLLADAETGIQETDFLLNSAGLNLQDAKDLVSVFKDKGLSFSASAAKGGNTFLSEKPAWKALVNWVSDISIAFDLIDGQVSKELQNLLEDTIPRYQVPNSIQALISLLKTDHSLSRYSNESSEQQALLERFSLLSDSEWLGNRSLEDILPMSGIDSDSAMTTAMSDVGTLLVAGYQVLLTQALAQEEFSSADAVSGHPMLQRFMSEAQMAVRKIPPSGIIAGLISRTDRERGVWKAPANVEISQVLGPVRIIDDRIQEDMNVHATGKSVNAIRTFPGRGSVVWGARTLEGNSLEWRYVPVRRLFIYVEELVKKTTERYVFEANDANTWLILRNAIDSFMRSLWRRGAFYGATAREAYDISVGLGQTMTSQDILEGKLIVEVGMAAVRPAEFIVIRYECRMEES